MFLRVRARARGLAFSLPLYRTCVPIVLPSRSPARVAVSLSPACARGRRTFRLSRVLARLLLRSFARSPVCPSVRPSAGARARALTEFAIEHAGTID